MITLFNAPLSDALIIIAVAGIIGITVMIVRHKLFMAKEKRLEKLPAEKIAALSLFLDKNNLSLVKLIIKLFKKGK